MEKFYCNSKFSELTPKEVKSLVEFLNNYCVSMFGINNRKPELGIEINRRNGSSGCYGWYDPNFHKVTLFTKEFKYSTVKEFADTFIHEYTHSLQPCLSKYAKLLRKHGYMNHPFEIEARDMGRKYRAHALSLYRKYN